MIWTFIHTHRPEPRVRLSDRLAITPQHLSARSLNCVSTRAVFQYRVRWGFKSTASKAADRARVDRRDHPLGHYLPGSVNARPVGDMQTFAIGSRHAHSTIWARCRGEIAKGVRTVKMGQETASVPVVDKGGRSARFVRGVHCICSASRLNALTGGDTQHDPRPAHLIPRSRLTLGHSLQVASSSALRHNGCGFRPRIADLPFSW